jgi:hypothetical protein
MSTKLSRLALAGVLASSAVAWLASTALAADGSGGVHVADPGVISGAQLIERLQSQGYTDVKLTSERPTTFTPHPELSAGLSSDEAAATPVHQGWNGTAVRDGRTVDIYVDEPTLRAASKTK